MSRQIDDRAVVLGASMAGLLAARVLADAYGQVTVIDRDQLPQAGTHRRGVPHGRHLHALLARGQQALEELFPGLTAELVAHGAAAGDVLGNGRWFLGGHRLRQAHTGLVALCASRPFLEGHVRARVRALPNLTILDRCQVIGLATTPDGRRVTGVRALRRADGNAGAEEVLGADLVIDAIGRGLGMLHGSTPEHPRGGALLLVEGGRWMVTLAGMLGDYPPIDPDGFLAFAGSLQFQDIYEAIRDATPLDDPVAFRFPASVRHRYERLPRFPDGLLVVGDAVCSFNPIYGQGMSVAALEALVLRRHLRRGVVPQPRRWFREIARVVDVPWDIAVGGDLVFPGVPGRRTAKVRLVNAYLARLHPAAAHDAGLASAFMRVAGLVAPPQSLLRPAIALRVLRGNLRRAATRPRGLRPASRTQDKEAA